MSALAGETVLQRANNVSRDYREDDDPAWNPQFTAHPPASSLVVQVDAINVTSIGQPNPGVVRVFDSSGKPVQGAWVTMIVPQAGSSSLVFFPSFGTTDQSGAFAFNAFQTAPQGGKLQFVVAASIPSIGSSTGT